MALTDWIGRTESVDDVVTATPYAALSATLDRPSERPDASVARFEFRAMRPLFDIHAFDVCGEASSDGSARLWAADHEGALAMDATAKLS
jgi:3-methylfumaryl-CoA hydratase